MDESYDGSNAIVKKAMELIGIPYVEGGLTTSGFSTSGFVYYVYSEAVGVQLPISVDVYQELGESVDRDDLQEGDILFLQGSTSLILGIYKGEDLFIIVTVSEGVQVRHLLNDTFWAQRYLFARRLTDRDFYYLNPENYKNHSNNILKVAVKYINTPYIFGGEDINVGIDCSYFIQLVFMEAKNAYIPRTTIQQWEVGEEIEFSNIQAGDVLFFLDTKKEGISHTAIYIGEGYFIHESGIEGKVSFGYVSTYWMNLYMGARRVDDLTLRLENPIIFEAAKYIGVPYLQGGITPEGFDTGGFVKYIFGVLGIDIPRYPSTQWKYGIEVDKVNLQVADIVFFQGTNSLISGIYSGNGLFLVVTASAGVAVRNLDTDTYWGPRYYGARRQI